MNRDTNIVSAAHLFWYIGEHEKRFCQTKPLDDFPWTQMGYTYDWCPAADARNNAGLSEYVVSTGIVYKTDTIAYSISEYFGSLGKK